MLKKISGVTSKETFKFSVNRVIGVFLLICLTLAAVFAPLLQQTSSAKLTANAAPEIGSSSVYRADIHTDVQNAYLLGDLNDVKLYARGREELSRPRAVVCDFSSDSAVENAESYVFQKASKADFSDAVTVTGLSEKSYELYNLKLGERFFWRGGVDGELENATVHEVEVCSLAPRNLYVSGVTNVRDIGGYSSSLAKNAYVRQGLFFRGAKLDDITAKGVSQLKELGVKTEIDLRDEKYCTGPFVDGVEYHAASIPSGTESVRFEKFNAEYKKIYSLVACADESPVYLHCSAGADRTGIASFMLLVVCGVGYEDVARDYLFTNFSTHGPRDLASEFSVWWSKLDSFDGKTKAAKAKGWLMSKGLTNEEVETIRKVFVAGYDGEAALDYLEKDYSAFFELLCLLFALSFSVILVIFAWMNLAKVYSVS